jgi:zinc transport system substrate-binding protein
LKSIFIFISLSTFIYANINAIVTIIPQKYFLEKIGKDKIDITTMIGKSNSPHTYKPKPSQMMSLSKADIYFSIDTQFEDKWLNKFHNINPTMKIVDLSKDIEKLTISHHSDNEDIKHTKHNSYDPHIWTSPSNVKIIIKNILDALIKIDVQNQDYYQQNYNDFLKEIIQTDIQIQNIFKRKNYKNRFVVFHPSWQYFARDYNLTQISIQVDGKDAKIKHIIFLMKNIKKQHINKIFTTPTFSNKLAIQLTQQLDIKLETINTLEYNWSQNLIYFAKKIGE